MTVNNDVNRKILIFRIVFYAVIITLSYLLLLISGMFAIVRPAIITVIFGRFILNDIVSLRNYMYMDNSVIKEIFRTAVRPLAAALVLMFTFYPLPSVHGTHPFQYSISKHYTEKLNSSVKNILPESLPDNISEYSFSYFPGFLQADSMLTVDITTDSNGIAQIEKFAEERAAGVLDLKMYMESNTNHQVDEFKKSYFKPDDSGYTADYFSPRTGKAGESEYENGKMYIISSNGNFNHPYTPCITINYKTSTVSFTY